VHGGTYDSQMSRESVRQGGVIVAVGVAVLVVCGVASAADAWRGFQYGILLGAGVVLGGLYVMVAPPRRRPKHRDRWAVAMDPPRPDPPADDDGPIR
jgi:hypothetical protein